MSFLLTTSLLPIIVALLLVGCGKSTDRAEEIVESVEETYYALRQGHPGRDEHWLLANTWLQRHGSTPEAKQKGSELTRYIAYNETHQFSILDPPQSVRALGLYLVYKELGAAAEPYGAEFGRLMEPVFLAKAEGRFFHSYKEKNPGTLSESRGEGAGPWSLSSLLSGYEFADKHPRELQELAEELGM